MVSALCIKDAQFETVHLRHQQEKNSKGSSDGSKLKNCKVKLNTKFKNARDYSGGGLFHWSNEREDQGIHHEKDTATLALATGRHRRTTQAEHIVGHPRHPRTLNIIQGQPYSNYLQAVNFLPLSGYISSTVIIFSCKADHFLPRNWRVSLCQQQPNN